ncbi:hypothetical protein AJ80_01750 [Polytolypa hystricis UAMH7299]|uniref:Uncharacterized protein n=1 Tax=Polytolypa hystricis (strain UAMH7299) TaxID=1447883 RepID=A0A2B7YZY0_POLH7|nr:hypothetical protein AJ80_01750 [Polytolypa hystricis UAMH7299]
MSAKAGKKNKSISAKSGNKANSSIPNEEYINLAEPYLSGLHNDASRYPESTKNLWERVTNSQKRYDRDSLTEEDSKKIELYKFAIEKKEPSEILRTPPHYLEASPQRNLDFIHWQSHTGPSSLGVSASGIDLRPWLASMGQLLLAVSDLSVLVDCTVLVRFSCNLEDVNQALHSFVLSFFQQTVRNLFLNDS